MPSNTAAYLEAPRANALAVKPAPEPELPSPTQVTIKTRSVGINPLDFLIQKTGMIVPESAYPYILGNDIAGEVVAVGSSVTKVKPGDRVLACAPNGCFQLCNNVEQVLLTRLPENISFAQGSAIPLALCTAAVILFQKDTLALDLPQIKPVSNGKVVVAWGGSSAVGSNGIQLLKAAGYNVVAVAGTNNQQYCKDIGADYVFDYKNPDVVTDIIKSMRDKLFAGVFCPIMDPDTIGKCVQIAAELGDNPKNKFVATSLPHSNPYQGELSADVSIGYCE